MGDAGRDDILRRFPHVLGDIFILSIDHVLSRLAKIAMQTILKEIVTQLSLYIMVSHCVCWNNSISEELESNGWVHHKLLIWVSIFRSQNPMLCAKANKTCVSALEDASIVVATQVFPFCFPNVALWMGGLKTAVKFVSKFIVYGVWVNLEELWKRYIILNCRVLSNFILEDSCLL